MLIKKTIVLKDNGATVGYVTLVRVGSEVGVKTVLNVVPRGTLTMGIKTTSGTLYTEEIVSARTESKPNISLMPADEVGIVIVDENGNKFADGGRKEAVNVTAVIKTAENRRNEDTRVPEQTEEAIPENKEDDKARDTATATSTEAPEEVSDAPDLSAISEDTTSQTVVEEDVVSDGTQDGLPPFYVNKGDNFYKNIRSRLNDIMTENPRDEELEKLIPESKWVRVYYDKDEYYVVGILSEEGEVTFLAYGVPGVEGIRPPKEAEELCDFLPIPGTPGEGYWIMFQNASNGEIAKSI